MWLWAPLGSPTPCPGPRRAHGRGAEFELILPHEDALPDWRDFDALLVLGGDDAPYQRMSRLTGETRLIAAAPGAGAPCLGICLGAQLMAAALGSSVFRGPGQAAAAPRTPARTLMAISSALPTVGLASPTRQQPLKTTSTR